MLYPNLLSKISYQHIFKNFQNEAVSWKGVSESNFRISVYRFIITCCLYAGFTASVIYPVSIHHSLPWIREISAESPFQEPTNTWKHRAKFLLLSFLATMTFTCVHVLYPTGRIEFPWTSYQYKGGTLSIVLRGKHALKRFPVMAVGCKCQGKLVVILTCFVKFLKGNFSRSSSKIKRSDRFQTG